MTIRLLALAAMVTLSLAGLTLPARGQDTADPTVSALETRVAELEATVAAYEASPVASPRVVETPLDLLIALLENPVDSTLLPEGIGRAATEQWEYGDDDLEGAIGGVITTFGGTETYGINYIVYPSAMDAEAAFTRLTENTGMAVALESTPVVPGEARVVFDFSDYVICAHLSGETIIAGGVEIGENVRIADAPALACAMTDAGLTHLRSIRGH